MLRQRVKHRAALASLAGVLLAFTFGAALGPSLWQRFEAAFAPAAGAEPPAAPPVAAGALKLLQEHQSQLQRDLANSAENISAVLSLMREPQASAVPPCRNHVTSAQANRSTCLVGDLLH